MSRELALLLFAALCAAEVLLRITQWLHPRIDAATTLPARAPETPR